MLKKTKTVDENTLKIHESEKKICEAEAGLKYLMIRSGDALAQREGYKEHKGLEAIRYYLIQKHHWLPGDVFAISDEHLRFLIAEEKL